MQIMANGLRQTAFAEHISLRVAKPPVSLSLSSRVAGMDLFVELWIDDVQVSRVDSYDRAVPVVQSFDLPHISKSVWPDVMIEFVAICCSG